MTRSFDAVEPAFAEQPDFADASDAPDHRDLQFASIARLEQHKLPVCFDIRAEVNFPAACEQGCTTSGACAVAVYATYLFYVLMHGINNQYSRLFLSYNASLIDASTSTCTRALLKALRRHGMCMKEDWPDLSWNVGNEPPQEIYKLLLPVKYYKVQQTRIEVMQAIAEKRPVLATITAFPTLTSAKTMQTGNLDMPNASDACGGVLGNVTCLLLGYDDIEKRFLGMFPYGKEWGYGGCCWLPYGCVLDPTTCRDTWVLSLA